MHDLVKHCFEIARDTKNPVPLSINHEETRVCGMTEEWTLLCLPDGRAASAICGDAAYELAEAMSGGGAS